MNTPRHSAGFTLVELMIVVAILAIIAAIAAPSFRTMIQNNRLTAAVNDVAGALQYARSEAVRRGRDVQVSALDSDISNGLRIWFDIDDDGTYDNGEELRVVNLSIPDLRLASEVDGNSELDVQLSYGARGTVSDALDLGLCDDRTGNTGRTLELLVSGVLRVTSGTTCS